MIVSGLTYGNPASRLRSRGHRVDVSITLDWYRQNVNNILDPPLVQSIFGSSFDLTKDNLLKLSVARREPPVGNYAELETLADALLNDIGWEIFSQFQEIAKSRQVFIIHDAFDQMMKDLTNGPFAILKNALTNATTDAEKKAAYNSYYSARQPYYDAYNNILKREWESYRRQIATMLFNCLSMLRNDISVEIQ